MKLLHCSLMLELQEDGAVATLAEGVVVVLGDALKGWVIEPEPCEEWNIHEALIGRLFVDVDIGLLEEQTVVHDDGLACEVDPEEAIPQIDCNHCA